MPEPALRACPEYEEEMLVTVVYQPVLAGTTSSYKRRFNVKIRSIFLAPIVLLISMLVVSTALAESPSPLTGHWTARDPIDGDTVHMTLSSGLNGIYQLTAFDIHAPGSCVEAGGLGLLQGMVTFDASTGIITKTVVASCPSEGITYPENTLEMQYDPVTDTIYDPTFNLLYTR